MKADLQSRLDEVLDNPEKITEHLRFLRENITSEKMNALSKVAYLSFRTTSEKTESTSLDVTIKTFGNFFNEVKEKYPDARSTELWLLAVKRLQQIKLESIQHYVDLVRALFWMEFILQNSEKILPVFTWFKSSNDALEEEKEIENIIAALDLGFKFLKFDSTITKLGDEFIAKNQNRP